MAIDPTQPRDEAGRFAVPAAPEQPPAPDWSAFEQAGITPDKAERAIQAMRMYEGLQNLDTRQQYLEQIIRPEMDGWVRPEPSEPDPWEQFSPPETDQQTGAFDPRALAPVFEQFEQRVEQRLMSQWEQRQQQQMFEQNFANAVSSAAAKHGLSEIERGAVEMATWRAAQTAQNRPLADLADEYAKQVIQASQQRFVQSQGGQPPVAAPQVPGGPIPSTDQRPKTDQEALEYSMRVLNPSQ